MQREREDRGSARDFSFAAGHISDVVFCFVFFVRITFEYRERYGERNIESERDNEKDDWIEMSVLSCLSSGLIIRPYA
jgi:hypothetical protein